MKELISVIIPVYNSENYLVECIESVLAQTYNTLEILLINDGSTDNSLEICKLYKEKDKRIKIYDKENEGVASARNCGLRYAAGNFIVWVDSDDSIECTYIENLYKESERHDWLPIISVRNSRLIRNVGVVEKEDIIIKFLNGSLPSLMWGTLFKKELYEGLRFKSYHIGEDSMMLIDLFSRVDKIYCIYNDGYHYRENPNSITRSNNLEYIKSWIDELNEQCKLIVNKYPFAKSEMSYKSTIFALKLLNSYKDEYIQNEAKKIIKRNFKNINWFKLSKHQVKEFIIIYIKNLKR